MTKTGKKTKNNRQSNVYDNVEDRSSRYYSSPKDIESKESYGDAVQSHSYENVPKILRHKTDTTQTARDEVVSYLSIQTENNPNNRDSTYYLTIRDSFQNIESNRDCVVTKHDNKDIKH